MKFKIFLNESLRLIFSYLKQSLKKNHHFSTYEIMKGSLYLYDFH